MTLTFGFACARDVLKKAHRDFIRLSYALESSAEPPEVADALFNFAVTVFHVKDWLKFHAGSSFTPQEVEAFVTGSVALSAFHDLCTASKHKEITRYEPTTSEVVASAVAQVEAGLGHFLSQTPRKTFVTKVVGKDHGRREAVALAEQALNEWETFFRSHAL